MNNKSKTRVLEPRTPDSTPVKKRSRRTKEEIKPHYVDAVVMEQLIVKYYEDGNMTNELAGMIQKIAIRLGFAQNFVNYCVDDQTEALTDRGWLKGKDIKLTDKIVSYDTTSRDLVWSPVKSVYVGNYKGKMHQLKTWGLDALVTPNHKFVSLEEGIKPVEEIKCQEHIILNGNAIKQDIEKYEDSFVELMGWCVTEGHYMIGKRTNAVQVFQKKGPKADRLRNSIIKLGIDFKEYPRSNSDIIQFNFNKRYANEIIKLAPDKCLSMEFLLDLSTRQRMLLLKTMVDGDGWSREYKGEIVMCGYAQKEKNHIDTFMALYAMLGISARTTLQSKIYGWTKNPYYKTNFFRNQSKMCYGENIDMNGGRSKKGGFKRDKKTHGNHPTIDYDGMVWCPETEYGTFLCRRNGHVYVTGNSYRDEMTGDAVVKMIAALIKKNFKCGIGYSPFSYFTKIAYRAFQNRIKEEKKIHEGAQKYQEHVYNILMESGEIPFQKNTHADDGSGGYDASLESICDD